MKKLKLFSYRVLFICLFILILSILIVLSSNYIYSPKPKKVSFNDPSNQLIYDKWYTQIQRLGGQKAYALFKTETDKKPMETHHTDAHLFVGALYQAEGSGGITACDSSFNYGCYHSFLSSAIYYENLDTIPKLSEKCV